MSPVVTLVLGALLYYAAVTGRAEAVYRALVRPAPATRKGQQDPVDRFFSESAGDVMGDIP